MPKIVYAIFISAMVTVLFPGCQNALDNKADSQAKVYDITGKIVAIDADKKSVKLDHEDVPGLMKAMTMSFPVDDIKVVEGLKPGDAVTGKLSTGGSKTGYTITHLEKR